MEEESGELKFKNEARNRHASKHHLNGVQGAEDDNIAIQGYSLFFSDGKI
jgi:hypothetical protein